MGDNLQERLADWIESSGRALELRVARSFSARASVRLVIQSHTYEDTSSKTKREGDVLAIYRTETDTHYLSLAVTVECKGGTQHPWVAFYDDRRFVPKRRSDWFLVGEDPSTPDSVIDSLVDAWTSLPSLGVDRVATHAVSALGKDPKDGAKNFVRDAMLQAYSFGRAKARAVTRFVGDEPTKKHAGVVIPLVVTKAPLFKCQLGSDGEIDLQPTERFDLWVPAKSGRRRVYVVSERQMGDMCHELERCMDAWARTATTRS